MLPFLLATVFAGVPIALPEGQSREEWSAALELADLVWAPSAVLSVREEGAVWVVRTVGTDGVVRSMRMAAPTNRASREDFAFLARSLARTVGVEQDPSRVGGVPVAPVPAEPKPQDPKAVAPAPNLVSRPLPVLPKPPPKPVPVTPEVLPVEPDPVEPDPVEPDPVEPDPVEPDPVQPDPVTPDPASVDVPGPVQPEPVADPVVTPDLKDGTLSWVIRPKKLRKPFPKIAYPPIFLSGMVRVRVYQLSSNYWGPAGSVGLDLRGVDTKVGVLDLGVHLNPTEWFWISDSSIARSMEGLTVLFRPGVRVVPSLLLQGTIGYEYRRYTQRGRLIDVNALPVGGLGLQFEPFSRWILAPFARVGAAYDLGITKFRDESRRESFLPRLQVFATLGLRFSSRSDPKSILETSTE